MPRPIATPDQFTELKLDADPILSQLYQGAYPKVRYAPAAAGFDVLVLCAKELQKGEFPGIIVMKVPLDDNGETITAAEWARAQDAGERVAKLVRNGANVLTTCAMGRNRSGLVNAIALYHLYPMMNGSSAINVIRRSRKNSLMNRGFTAALRRLS